MKRTSAAQSERTGTQILGEQTILGSYHNRKRSKRHTESGCGCSGKTREGGGFRFEGGDGFDEARNREGVADAARAADQPKHAPITRELDRDFYDCGDTGAVNLRDAIQDDNHLARAVLDDGIKSIVDPFTRFTDSEPAVDIQNRDATGLADIDFHGRPVSHGSTSTYPLWVGMAVRHDERHYTPERELHKGNCSR